MSNFCQNMSAITGFFICVFLIQIISVKDSQASLLTCACNTQECRSQGSNRCIATNMCFVQYNPTSKFNRRKSEPVRGCINRSTPLLCENRPPTLMGDNQPAWPVLHCCSSQMCNRNIVPTSPPRLGPAAPLNKKNDSNLKTTMEDSEIVPADPILSESDESTISDSTNDEAANPIQTILSQSSRILTVEKVINVSDSVEPGPFNSNLLYIIIPALAVVFLLSLLVIALRRKSEYMSTEDLVNSSNKKNFRNLTQIYLEDEDTRVVMPHDHYFSFQTRHI